MQYGFRVQLLAFICLLPLAACAGAVVEGTARQEGESGDDSPQAGEKGSGNGQAGEGGNADDFGNDGANEFPEKAPPAASACKDGVPGPRSLRRLTGAQLTATVRDLFADPNVPTAKVFDDALVLGFKRDADKLMVRGLGAQQIMDYAEEVATWAVTNKLTALSSCQQMDAPCRKQFVASFGKRAFRTPLTSAQMTSYEMLFSAESSFLDGVEAVVAAMLQSPHFLYRSELGQPKNGDQSSFALTSHEVASGLSYLILGSMPDAELMAAADAGELKTQTQIDKQVQRLLESQRSQDIVAEFMVDWLELGHLQSAVKNDKSVEFDAALKADMLAETRAFVVDNFRNNGKLADLFSAKHTFVNSKLSSLYRINGAIGDSFSRVTLADGQRDSGILAHGSVLAGHANATGSSPTFRGKLVRTRLLCQDLPPPPANLDTMLKPPGSVATTRERFEQHSTDPACAGCHNVMDPIGYAFEHYDGFGRRREQENGVNINARGKVADVQGGDVEINGLADLNNFLSTSPDVQKCMVRFWSYFAFGKSSWSQDACTYEAVESEASKEGFGNAAMIRALTRAPHFTARVKDL